MYTIQLSEDEQHALIWLGSRGYCGGQALLDAVIRELDNDVYALTEHGIHDWAEQAKEDGKDGVPYWTCASDTLAAKLQKLFESLV